MNLSNTVTYTAQIVLAVSALSGYILLLCGRRVGLYAILIGGGVMLGAQTMSALSNVLLDSRQSALLVISNLIGALNPLFVYLAVRADRATVRHHGG